MPELTIELLYNNPEADSPKCSACNACLYGQENLLCHCPQQSPLQAQYQREYLLLIEEIQAAEAALIQLENSPFRQLRNAFGFGSGIVSGVNIVLGFFLYVTSAIAVPALVLPSIILGAYVYFRGRREESEINVDAQIELKAKKSYLINKFQISVEQRYQNQSTLIIDKALQTVPAKPKEKRSILGNPFSHLIGSSIATLGIFNALIKFTLFAAVIGGGPIAWGIAGGVALSVGIYFFYKRYHYLESKKNFENKMAILTARTTDIKAINKQVKKLSSQRINEKLQTLQSENTALKIQLAKQPSQAEPSSLPTALNEAKLQWSPRLHRRASRSILSDPLIDSIKSPEVVSFSSLSSCKMGTPS